MKTPILGGAYVARSINAADNRLVNLFPEAVPEGSGGKEGGFLSRCPGLSVQTTVGSGPIRGLWQYNGYAYAVSGSELYKIDSDYGATKLGDVTGTGPVSMVDNGTQLFVACNPDGFIYNDSTLVFAQITDVDFPGAVTVGYLDGYFVFNEPNSQKFWVTSLLDGTSVDPLDFASAEGYPDDIVSLNVNHREIWLFGNNSIEVWYNAGTPDFPMARIQGAFMESGCEAAYSVAKLDNALYWLGSDARGRGMVYRSNGYNFIRVSTHAIEYEIQNYGDISDAIGYTYQQAGHAFYVLTFPNAQKTWCYDVATQLWHERANFQNGQFGRHRSNCQMAFNDEVIVGDYQNGNLYAFNLNSYATEFVLLLESGSLLLLEDGNPMGLESTTTSLDKWLRSWRALATGTNNLKRTAQHSLQLDCEAGVGLTKGQGSNPEVLLRWSDDGGHTWSNYHSRTMGQTGEYGQRVIWRRLGMTEKLRDRVYEVTGTDPVKVVIMGAELFVTPTRA